MMNRDIKYLNQAFELAKSVEPVRGARVAAILVHKKYVVGYGYGHMKSHPFQSKYKKNPEAVFFHAETHAIKNALRSIDVEDLRNCTLYVARARKGDGKSKYKRWRTGLAKPCPGCAKCIEDFDVNRVVYTENG